MRFHFDSKAEKIFFWCVFGGSVLYFGGHVVYALLRKWGIL